MNTSPESPIAGGAVTNRADTNLRYSEDRLDIFYDGADSIAACAAVDALALLKAGNSVAWVLRQLAHGFR